MQELPTWLISKDDGYIGSYELNRASTYGRVLAKQLNVLSNGAQPIERLSLDSYNESFLLLTILGLLPEERAAALAPDGKLALLLGLFREALEDLIDDENADTSEIRKAAWQLALTVQFTNKERS